MTGTLRGDSANSSMIARGVQWFDPNRDAMYPDRIRRRPPGADSAAAPAAAGRARGRHVRRHQRTGLPRGPQWLSHLLEALSGIPDVKAGDSVRWHCDVIHSVAPVVDQEGWDNVMYIPTAPWCPRNEEYAASVREAFRTGSSPHDFPAEHYERDWTGRFTYEQLNETGRRGLGFD